MAKLKAPLMSLGAAGALGKALVFFGWKGLDVVREYVIPANPKTTKQTTQRGYVTAAVAAIHTAQALATYPLAELDTVAYALWGSTFPTPRTWFNQVVKNWLDVLVAGKTGSLFRGGFQVEQDTQLATLIHSAQIDATNITAAHIFWGKSKTALVNSAAATITSGENAANYTITGLTNGVKYYWQYRVDDGENCEGVRSGLYYGTPTA